MTDLTFAPTGPLFFPVTPFDDRGRVEVGALEAHLASRLPHRPGGVFIACGTGEFHALSLAEYSTVVEHGVRVTAGAVPVVAGTGGPLGHALACAVEAERLGADALLVLPPYLVAGPQDGIVAYVEAIAAATRLPLIIYHRGASQFTVDSIDRLIANPSVVGIKDGVGDVALAQEFVLAAERAGRDDILFFNGLLTAELSQLAYRSIGIPLYSSAVFAMAPDIAGAFFTAYTGMDDAAARQLLDGFYAPLVRLRDAVPGYAVSLIKAGVTLDGVPAGSVRAPLVDPSPQHLSRLAAILERGRELVA